MKSLLITTLSIAMACASYAQESAISANLSGNHPLLPLGMVAKSFPHCSTNDYIAVSGQNIIFVWRTPQNEVFISTMPINKIKIRSLNYDQPYLKFKWLPYRGQIAPRSFEEMIIYIVYVELYINEPLWEKQIKLEKE